MRDLLLFLPRAEGHPCLQDSCRKKEGIAMAKKLMKGNVAVVMGAILADCHSFYGYPITPASEITETAANLFPRLGRTFLQAESEVSFDRTRSPSNQ